MSCGQYRDSLLSLSALTVVLTDTTDNDPPPPPPYPPRPKQGFNVTFHRLKLVDSCGRTAVCAGGENDGYSATQSFFYDYPIFLNQPQLAPGLYFLLLAPLCCPCAVRLHGLVVGDGPDGNAWPVVGIEGQSNRCRRGQGLPASLPTINSALPTGSDGKRGDPATITFSRAVAGGPTANEEQLVTLGPGNCFGLGEAVITNRVLDAFNGLGLTAPNGDLDTFYPPGELVTPGLYAPGIQITRETAGFRIGYFGAYGQQSIALPTVKTSPANTLRSAEIAHGTSDGSIMVTAPALQNGEYQLADSAGCTGALGGTTTSYDGTQTLTVSPA